MSGSHFASAVTPLYRQCHSRSSASMMAPRSFSFPFSPNAQIVTFLGAAASFLIWEGRTPARCSPYASAHLVRLSLAVAWLLSYAFAPPIVVYRSLTSE